MVAAAGRGQSRARVLDFGVAKVMSPDELGAEHIERTSDAFSCFSLPHAAPEQVGRLRTGPWTDVHALALLLVELLTGRRALRGANSVELFSSITSKQRPTPSVFGVEVGPWEEILASALSLVAAARPRDAGALLAALESTLAAAQDVWTHPITTTAPAPPVERPSRTAERDRSLRPFALAALAATALGAWSLRDTAPPPQHSVARGAPTVMTTRSERPVLASQPTPPAAPPAPVAERIVDPPPLPRPTVRHRATRAPTPRATPAAPPGPVRVEVDGVVID